MFPKTIKNWLICTGVAFSLGSAWAQAVAQEPGPASLRQVFEAAWARQPEALSAAVRREASAARREAAERWTAEPAALELSSKGDQLNGDDGAREHNVGVAVALWLPGERSRLGAVAEAEAQLTHDRLLAAQLRVAAEARAAYWAWRRAQVEDALAGERLDNARRLARDVGRRVESGELAPADRHQAEAATALAEIDAVQAGSALVTARQQLRNLLGGPPGEASLEEGASAEPMPVIATEFAGLDARHPAVAQLLSQAELARRAAELAQIQTRANPELSLSTTRERDPGEPYQESLTLGIRIPFGSGSRNRATQAAAQAEAIEAEAQARLARERLLNELDDARLRVDSARLQANAAQKRARLAGEARGFFEKSFRLGESDLPTRLRMELDDTDARRQAALARLEQAAAVSALRQALGLLPE
jgi:outer membrane protein TolC